MRLINLRLAEGVFQDRLIEPFAGSASRPSSWADSAIHPASLATYGVGADITVAADTSGNVNAVFFDADSSNPDRMAFWNSSNPGVVSTVNTTGAYMSLSIDSSGNAHLGWHDGFNLNYFYLASGTSVWTHTTVATPNSTTTGAHLSLALDPNNSERPAMSYYDNEDDELRYTYFDGSVWQDSRVQGSASVDVGVYSSLAFDSQGNPGIRYHADQGVSDTNFLRYAYHDGTSWQRERDCGHRREYR